MFDYLNALLREQTSADEVLTFVFLVTLVSLLVAFAAYVVALAIIWKLWLRKETPLLPLIAPGRTQLRKYAPEYVLAIVTSLLLTYTVAARHNTVELILANDVQVLDAVELRASLSNGVPLHLLDFDPPASRLDSAIVKLTRSDSARAGLLDGVGIRTLLRPLLKAGRESDAAAIIAAAARRVPPSSLPFAPQTALLIVAILLLLAYAAWFAYGRASAKDDNSPELSEYKKIGARFSIPAVCIALLLATALGPKNEIRAAKAALERARSDVLTGDEVTLAARIEAALPRQQDRMQLLDAFVRPATLPVEDTLQSTIISLTRQIAELMDSSSAHAARITASEGMLRTLPDTLAAPFPEIRDGLAAAARLARELGGLPDAVRALEADVRGAAEAARRDQINLSSRLDALQRTIASLNSELRGQITQLRDSVNGLQVQLAAMSQRPPVAASLGYVLVVADPGQGYTVIGGGRTVTDSGTALHALPPGTYTIRSANIRVPPVELQPGGSATVRIARDGYVVGGSPSARRDAPLDLVRRRLPSLPMAR